VTLIFDEALMAQDVINAHPLTNDATTSIATDGSEALSSRRPVTDVKS
jgi:hypothetical protein